jgi:hypothetical protein
MTCKVLTIPDGSDPEFHGGPETLYQPDTEAACIAYAKELRAYGGHHFIVVDGLVTVFDTRAPRRGPIA